MVISRNVFGVGDVSGDEGGPLDFVVVHNQAQPMGVGTFIEDDHFEI